MTLHRSCFAAATLVATLAALAPPAAAVWPVNPKVNVPVCTAPGPQSSTLGITTDYAGGAYVAWSEARNGNQDIFVQHLLGAGCADPAWPVNGLGAVVRTYDQLAPQLVIDGAGGALLVWVDAGSSGYGAQLFAHHLRSNGTLDPAWPAAGRQLSSVIGHEYNAVCTLDLNGGVALAWVESRGATGYDIYVQRVSQAGALTWGASGLLACGIAGDVYSPAICSDWGGGAVVAWQDYRKATGYDYDIYATRVRVNGTLDPRWAAGGVALCTLTGSQEYPGILEDGLGGAFVAWRDGRSGTSSDLYAMHVREDGTLDPAWPAGGRLVHSSAGNAIPMLVTDGSTGFLVVGLDSCYVVDHVLANGVLDPAWPVGGVRLPPMLINAKAVSDGAGGLVLVYEDYRADPVRPDIGAHRVHAYGMLDPGWPAGGRTLCSDPAEQYIPAAVTDGLGGAIAAWVDARDAATTNYDVYAQRVRWTGLLGIPEPRIVSAMDIRGDEGGRLLLAWNASEGDAAPNPYVGNYHLWRKVNESAAAARAAASPVADEARIRPRPGEVRARGTGAHATWWEFIATVPASQQPGYAYLVPTTADSLPGWIPWNVFVVDAEDNTTWAFYSSAPDSGYSADNLPPHFPAPCFGQYTQGMTALQWPPSPEPDFALYRLYRSTDRNFWPGPENFVVATPDAGYLDYPGQPCYYILQSVDVHGNASPNALIEPDGILDAGGPAVPKALAFRGAHPNPARGAAAFAFDLPTTADVRITVFDVSGRRVGQLKREQLPAGTHRLAWDGRDASGATVAAGLYLARFEALGVAKRSRFVLTK